jgi:hypothetical protein
MIVTGCETNDLGILRSPGWVKSPHPNAPRLLYNLTNQATQIHSLSL